MMMDTPEPSSRFAERHHDAYQQSEGGHLQPGSLQPDPIGPPTITGRMPTPIQPSFAAQVRGGSKNWGGAAGNIMSTPPPQHIRDSALGTNGSLHASQQDLPGFTGSAAEMSLARSLQGAMPDWNLVQNRRLPSPISETGGEAESGQGSSGMIMDSTGACHDYHGSPQGLFSHPPSRASSAMEMGGSWREVSVPPRVATPHVVAPQADGSMDVEAATPSPPRKGHNRSRHTVNNWTQQPGMKKSFSIGYRSDCEKCRLKVPGHFNHIIIS